jgi:CheY-like chemotaxis protein
MIRILIVDDSETKRKNISNVILDNNDILNSNVVEVACVKDARKLLYKEYFDLMILDLVLPVEVGGDSSPDNGVGFLGELAVNPSIKLPIHVVGISGFRDEVLRFNKDFSSRLWNLLDYDESSNNWQDQLQSIIFHLVRTRQQFISASFTNQSDIIIAGLDNDNLPNTLLGFSWAEVAEKISIIVEKALDVPKRFSNGSRAKNINTVNLKINSEYDFQNLIHIVLRPWLPSIEPENIAVIFDGNTKNADFSLKGNSLIIEAKYIDSTGKKNDTLKTLSGLRDFYRQNANVKALLFIILVEPSVDIDKHKVEEEFTQRSKVPSTIVKVIFND